MSTVAQAESTRAYFLAQTLESTKTVPVVSAKLPLDSGTNQGSQAGADGGQIAVGSEDKVTDGDLPTASTEAGSDGEPEGGEDSDESDLAGVVTLPGVSAESTVVGSFIYRGITYAVEPGGESVTVVAADYAKLPSEFIEAQTIVLPSMVSSDGIDYYTVSRIADYAFSSLTEAAALATSGDAGVDASSDVGAEEEPSIGITAITIPASITEIGDDAFTNFGTLQYVIVSEDNPVYGMYDGCLYDAELTSLLPIPEGRLGAVCVAPSAENIDPETFSHCASLDTIYADADSAAYQLLAGDAIHLAQNISLSVAAHEGDDAAQRTAGRFSYRSSQNVDGGVASIFLNGSETSEDAMVIASEPMSVEDDRLRFSSQGVKEVAYVEESEDGPRISVATILPEDIMEGEAVDYLSRATNGVTVTTAGSMVGTMHYVQAEYFVSITDGDHSTIYFPMDDASLGHTLRFYQTESAPLYNKQYLFRILRTTGARMEYVYDCLEVAQYNSVHSIRLGTRSTNTYSQIDSLYFTNTYETIPREFRLDNGTGTYTDNSGKWTFWFNDYTYDQPIGVRFVSEYYTGENGRASHEYSQGAWVDGATRTIEKTQMSDAGNGTPIKAGAAPSEDKKMAIVYPEAPQATSGDYIFKGWRTSPNLDEEGEWYYLANGFRDADYVEATDAYRFVTLYAIYEQGYPVVLDDVRETTKAGEGSFAALNEELKVKERVSVPESEGYRFNGYYELIDGERNYWYDSDGALVGSIDGPFSEAGHVYPLTSNVMLYADWVRDVVLDTQGATSPDPDQAVHVSWLEALPSQALANAQIALPVREGYVFNGYWSTPYDESDPDKDLYYEVKDGAVVPVAGKTWDIDQDRLYAHWKYRIELDANAMNSDGQSALGDSKVVYEMTGYAAVAGSSNRYTDAYGNLYTVNTVGDDQVVSVEAIDGAPVRLPTVGNRTGYTDSQAWGVTQQANGNAADLFALVDGYTAKDGAAADIAEANTAFAGSLQLVGGLCTATLFADWNGNHELSGTPKKYQVKLITQYLHEASGHQFNSTAAWTDASNLANQTIEATYDAPMPVTNQGNYPTYSNTGSSITNLSLLGFFTQTNDAFSSKTGPDPSGTCYIKQLASGGFEAEGKFRPVPADGADIAQPFLLYALWGYPDVKIDFQMQVSAVRVGSDENVAHREFTVTTNDPMPTWGTGKDAVPVPVRPGYTFNGFWNTKYSETRRDLADMSGAEPKQYYAADGTCLYAGNGTVTDADSSPANPTWDETVGITLYAHWVYDINLNLNTNNASHELVVKTDADRNAQTGSDGVYEYDAVLAADDGATMNATEQGAIEEESFSISGLTFENGTVPATAPAGAEIRQYAFSTVYGAPVQLPSAQGRTGYEDTTVWKTLAGDAFEAGKTVSNTGMGEPTIKPGTSEAAPVTLYADWTGKAKTYWVELRSAYANDGDAFAVKEANAASQFVEVTYDTPLAVTGADVYGADGQRTGDSVVIVHDDTYTNGEPRNLRLKGYFTGAGTAAASAGRQYVGVGSVDADGDATSLSTDGTFFRETTDEARTGIQVETKRVNGADRQVIVLYAWWSYNRMNVVFDLQGGRISGDPFAGKTFTIATMDPVSTMADSATSAALTPAQLSVPVRAGYEFAGWWNTPYRENDDYKETDDSNVTIVPTCYFTTDGSTVTPAVGADGSEQTWQETRNDVTLYAHWKYTIRFDENLLYDDSAVVDYALVDERDTGYTSGLVSLKKPGANSEFDIYGNERTIEQKTLGGRSVNTVVVRAIAGAPVELPYAHTRLTREGDVTGYRPTAAWHATKDSASLQLRDPVAYRSGTTEVPSNLVDGIPCAITFTTAASGPVNGTVELHADWTNAAKEYYVKLVSTYDYADASGTTAYVPYEEHPDTGAPLGKLLDDDAIIKVTYDQPVPQLQDAMIPFGAQATLADGTVHGNLDFNGFTSGANPIGAAGANTTKYLDANGACNGANPSNCQTYFRLASPLAETARYDDASAATPIPLYALWNQPIREVELNFYDANTTAASTTSAAFTLKADGGGTSHDANLDLRKGDSLATADLTKENQDDLALVASALAESERIGRYRFNGFWTSPYQESEYQEQRQVNGIWQTVTVTPVKYFDLSADRSHLAAASTGLTWNEDAAADSAPIMLYAHWTYEIELEANPIIPAVYDDGNKALWQGGADRLRIGSATVDEAKVTVNYGTFVFGQPIALPYNDRSAQNPDGQDVARVRTIDGANAEAGYTFAGWYAEAALTTPVTATAADFQSAPDTLTPTLTDAGARSVAKLYADWVQDVYTIRLLADYGDWVYKNGAHAGDHQSLEGGYTTLIGGVTDVTDAACVRYDEPLSAVIAAPQRHGYAFIGYFTEPQTTEPVYANNVYQHAGQCFYEYDASFALNDQRPNANAVWAPTTRTLDTTTGTLAGTLYAHFARTTFNASFVLREMPDGAQPTDAVEDVEGRVQTVSTGSAFRNNVTGLYYGMPLANAGFQNTVGATAGDVTFSREGYKFLGWYYYAGESREKADRIYVYVRSAADADAYVTGNYRYDEATGSITPLDAATTPYLLHEGSDLTFYAAWTPNTYKVTFYTNYPNTGSDAIDVRTFRYEQKLEGSGEGNVPQVSHAPYTMLGWYDQRSQDVTGVWLYDGKPNADQSNRLITGGRFMPTGTKASASELVYYAAWEAPSGKRITALAGAHGKIERTAGGEQLAYREYPFSYGSTFYLSQVRVAADLGWVLDRWIEVPESELSPTDFEADGVTLTAAAIARLNGREFQDDSIAYPAQGNITIDSTYKDYYLVAVYRIAGSYSVTLDPAEGLIGDWAGGAEGTANTVHSFNTVTWQPDASGEGGSYVPTPAFALPSATRLGYTFDGWLLEGSATPENPQGTVVPAGTLIDPAVMAGEANQDAAKADRAYTAQWTANDYTIRFDMRSGVEGDELVLDEKVSYEDKIAVPYPRAHGNAGSFLRYFSLNVEANDVYGGDAYYPREELTDEQWNDAYTVRSVLANAQRIAKIYTDAGMPSPVKVDLENKQITFFAQWYSVVSATVPAAAVTIKMDPYSGDMVAATSNLTAHYGQGVAANTGIEVVSLHYERTDSNGDLLDDGTVGSVFDIGTDRRESADAEVDLSIYVGEEAHSRPIDLTLGGNVDRTDGSVLLPATGTTYRPLLIDTAHTTTIPKRSSVAGAPQLEGTGFAEFTSTRALPLTYGLVFKGTYDGGTPLDPLYFVQRGTLKDSTVLGEENTLTPIGRLYYTVQLTQSL